MPIQWKVIHSKKKSKGYSSGCYYEVKHFRGNGWVGGRYPSFHTTATHTVGPFKHKEECMQALETIDALVGPEKSRLQWDIERVAKFAAMYGSGVSTFMKGVKK